MGNKSDGSQVFSIGYGARVAQFVRSPSGHAPMSAVNVVSSSASAGDMLEDLLENKGKEGKKWLEPVTKPSSTSLSKVQRMP